MHTRSYGELQRASPVPAITIYSSQQSHNPEASRSLSGSTLAPMSSIEKPWPEHPVPDNVRSALQKEGLQVDEHGIVTWIEGTSKHPRRWPLLRKIYDSAIIILLECVVTLASNTGSALAHESKDELRMSEGSALLSFTTVYLLGQALGGLVFPPLSESFGGRSIYVYSTFGYAITSIIIGYWPLIEVIFVGRFVSGLHSAMPAVVALGSIENMWNLRARIWVVHLWIAGAVIGLALGPATATYVSRTVCGWHWVFIGAAIITFVLGLLCMAMEESRPSQLLRQKVKVVSRETRFKSLTTNHKDSLTLRGFIRDSLTMPLRLFFTEPIVFVTSIMAATVFGITYMFAEALGHVYELSFGFSREHSSLVFLAIAVGVAFTFLPRMYDLRVLNKRRKQNRLIEPEDKLFGFYIAAPVLAIGLWWCAFTIPPLTTLSPWISISSLILFGFAVVEFDNVLSGYLTDTYATYAASANAPMAILRATLSGTFPLFGTQFFQGLGNNTALFVLAGLATLYCAIAVLFGLFGKKIRQKSPFAEKTWAKAQSEEMVLSKGPPGLDGVGKGVCIDKIEGGWVDVRMGQ